ncbi:MAG: PTS sugar transporter subunit IIA [Proteobacteria bacterium]|nr:PTS sugar transporter subunit IIA [Pseudomonadota bacterium]
MKIIDLLETEKIILDLPFTSKKRLFEYVSQQLGDSKKQAMRIYDSFVAREKLGNTSLGNGIAVPHGKCLESNEIQVCLVRLTQDSDYESVDENLIRFVVGIAFPKDTKPLHQDIMNDTVVLFRQHRLYRLLLNAKSRKETLNIILEFYQSCNS